MINLFLQVLDCNAFLYHFLGRDMKCRPIIAKHIKMEAWWLICTLHGQDQKIETIIIIKIPNLMSNQWRWWALACTWCFNDCRSCSLTLLSRKACLNGIVRSKPIYGSTLKKTKRPLIHWFNEIGLLNSKLSLYKRDMLYWKTVLKGLLFDQFLVKLMFS